MTITKNIGYAYPTSPLAKDLGYNTTGCYYVALYDDSKPISKHNVVYACLLRSDAIMRVPSVAGSHVEWGIYSMHKND